MEESEKTNRKKKLPSIPPNYVSLLQLQEQWMKGQEQKRKEKENEENEEPRPEQKVEEKLVEERVADEVAGRAWRKNGHVRRYNRKNGKPKEEETSAGFAIKESEGVEQEKKGEESKKKKKKKKPWKNKKKDKKEEKAGAENEGEKVEGPAVNAPLPASVENKKREEAVIEDDVQAPKQETVEARTEFKPRIITRPEDRTAEIGQRFREMSVKGQIRTGDYCRYGRQNGYYNRRGGNRELNRSYYGKFDRWRREQSHQGNEGMVWVKKGEVTDGNAGGIQTSSCSSKELD